MTRAIQYTARTLQSLFSILTGALLLITVLPTATNASPGEKDHLPPTVTITVNRDYALGNGIQQDKITVHFSPVPPGTAVLTFVVNGVYFGGSIDASGNAVFALGNPAVSDLTVDVVLDGTTVATTVMHFVASAGPPDLSNPLTRLIVDIPSTTADGVSFDQVHAHVVDANSNPVSNANVVFFSIAGGSAGGTAVLQVVGTGVTDMNGDIVLLIRDPKVGNVDISAKIAGFDINNSPATVQFTVGVPDLTNPLTQLIVDNGSTVADGASTDQVHAHIVDATGNPVPNVPVTFTVVGGSANGTAVTTVVGTGVTDANGNVVLTITNTKTGTVDISAKVGGVDINNSPGTVQFVADVPDLTNPLTQLIVDVPSTTADGVSQDKVHAHVVDKNNNPVAFQTVVFYSVTGGTAGGTAVITVVGTGQTDANGDVALVITNLKSGTVIISAKIGGADINNSPGTVQFVAGPPDLTNPLTQLIVDNGTTTADGTSTDQVHAHIVDANGNPVPGVTVNFTVAGGTVGGTAVITVVGTGVTDANGDVVLLITNTKVGTTDISAKVGGADINNSPATVQFVVGAPDVSNPSTRLIVDNGSTTADGTSTDQVHAHVVDKSGNPVPGVTVVFTVAGGSAGGTAIITVVGTGVTDANGDVTLVITNLKAGDVNISAKIGGADINNSPATVKFVAGPPDVTRSATQLIVDKSPSPADGVSKDIVHAHLVDANDNPCINQSVQLDFSIWPGGTANASALLNGGGAVMTDANGDVILEITNNTAGTVNIGAKVNGNTISNSAVTVVFTNIPDVNNPLTNLSVTANNALADGQAVNSVKAHVVDLNGNVMEGQTVVFTIQSGNGQIITTGPWVTDANGDVTIDIVSSVAGNVLITATVGNQSIKFGSPAKVRFVAINIYVPHVFTPNGDGVNDVLKPILVGIAQFHYFSIYNRWGNLIYTTQDANAGWDGRWKGVVQPVETYLWMAEGIDTEGKRVLQKGMVSLVR